MAASLDHVTLKVTDFGRAAAFYDSALAPLGLTRLFGDDTTFAGYGSERPFFWIGRDGRAGYAHVAFASDDRSAVDAFHAAALVAGGRDNGEPGIRPHYHPTYYGAFVLDPDGNNIEAVCHQPDDTHHLMSSPSNARRPSDAVRQLEAGRDRDEVERSEMQD